MANAVLVLRRALASRNLPATRLLKLGAAILVGTGLLVWWLLSRSPESGTANQLADASRTASASPPGGSESLFNGRDLNGWSGDSRFWSVQDGCITGKMPGKQKAAQPSCLVDRKSTRLNSSHITISYAVF